MPICPWLLVMPRGLSIGVTMVGIHARTGREKIFSQQIAHVLNDETQRKYIQVSMMTCMSVIMMTCMSIYYQWQVATKCFM